MNVTVNRVPESQEEEVRVFCHDENAKWVEQIKSLQNSSIVLSGKNESGIYNVTLSSVFYFEVVDNRSFFYTVSHVFESKLKLYEFEELSKNAMFFKASKSAVINIKKIKCVKPSYSGKFEVTLMNDNKIMVSRLYVTELKKIMGI